MKQKFLFIILVLLSISSYAQTNTDSLWTVWSDENLHDTIRLEAIFKYAQPIVQTSDPDSAQMIVMQILDFATKHNQIRYQAKAYRKLITIEMRSADWVEAQKYAESAFHLYKQINNKKGMAYSLWDLGVIFIQMSQNAKAVRTYSNCLLLLEEIGDYCAMSGVLNNMGLIYEDQDDFESALEYYQRSVKIGEQEGCENNTAKNNVGDIYTKQGNYNKALIVFEQLISKAEEKPGLYYDFRMSWLYKSIAKTHLAQGNNELALSNYFKSLNHSYQDSTSIGTNFIETDIGKLYLNMGDVDPAIEWCTKGLKSGKKGRSISLQKQSCQCLYEAYKISKDDSKALGYLELIQMLDDSLKSQETTKAILEMEFRKQVLADSLQQANQNLKTELAYQKETGKKDMIRNLSFGVVILLLFIATTLYRRNRFVNKAKISIEKEKEKAESSEKAKHQFLANMSHEIRTPMNAIKGLIDILIRRHPKEEQFKYLNGIKDSSDSLLVIINDILDISKIEAGKIELEHIPFSILQVIQNVHMIMQFKAEEKGLDLKSDIPDDIPQFLGDPARLRQVILNLVGNALKFTEKGFVTTSLKMDPLENDNIVNLHFTISDTGIGIDEDHLKRVFNSFEQAYSDTTRKFGGTGLGLSISKKLVDIHNGKIWVESKKGVGSQFHFTIPYEVCKEQENIEEESTTSNIENIRNQLKGVRVLLAEDNAFNAVVAREELQDAIEEAKIVVAENGAIAVEQISHSDFDVVLMDVQMPVMNGYEATKSIRKLGGEKSSIPIIAMTANVLKEEVALCYKAGMNDFIGKPFDTEELIQKIYKLTHKQT